MPLHYKTLDKALQDKILEDRRTHTVNPYRFDDSNVIRRDNSHDKANLWRPAFVRDAEKILHLGVYNRYADKTQVFSFYKNDDITRRGLHVQLVARIAKNIGAVLGLNLDLIEAIALGHDIGHTPFGHAGEKLLSGLLQEYGGPPFHHNVQSVRVLDVLYRRNISLQTLDGILCHNGEFEMEKYAPLPCTDFEEFDRKLERCYRGDAAALTPTTLEGCVVRVSDLIAYLGKDRQDAKLTHIINDDTVFKTGELGTRNAEIINNLVVDIIENSYGKNYIQLSKAAFNDLKTAKEENYRLIYNSPVLCEKYKQSIEPMFAKMYRAIMGDLQNGTDTTYVFRHHITPLMQNATVYRYGDDYRNQPAEMIAADYIASMTDDYFVDLYTLLFPHSPYRITYHSYFEEGSE